MSAPCTSGTPLEKGVRDNKVLKGRGGKVRVEPYATTSCELEVSKQ
jgi:hypothetical protein